MKQLRLNFFSIAILMFVCTSAFSQKVFVIPSNTDDSSISEVNKLKVFVTSDTLLFDVSVFFASNVGEMVSNKSEYNTDAIWATMPNSDASCITIKYVNTSDEADLVIRLAPDANSAWWQSEEKKALFNSKKKSNCN